MKVILLERVTKLGGIGDLVDVKSGFARNFLLPTKKALRATKDNILAFDARRAHLEEEDKKRLENAKTLAKAIEGTRIILVRQASEVGHLYGSVRSRDIAEALVEQGFEVEKTHVHIMKPIKTLGTHDVRIVFHPEVTATISTVVALSVEEVKARDAAPEAEEEVAVEAYHQEAFCGPFLKFKKEYEIS
jgi:large subunit ribosomal protein L9